MSKEVARKLKAARKKLNITQVELAQKLGVPSSTFIAWENDQRTPRGLSLEALKGKLDALLKE